ncbi:MAG: hypothetical protein ACLUC0_06170 [Clostridium neonatale]|uniref:hypothetical protein n=1 Tax=Clostridium neonatale TaxID=137838 RepID=UPI00291B5417|nr:hypothetical protein [Clostridium neonatale]CAI3543068.1 conserved hypothetical protein [Clostridium neonatale]
MIGNSQIINKFFTNELSKITEKYNKLDSDKINKIEVLMNKISDEDFKQELYSDFDEVIKLVNELDEDLEEAVLNIYVFMNKNDEYIDIEKAKKIYEEVNYNDYYTDGDIIIYSRLEDIREYVKDNIHDILSNSYEVDRIFDKDTIIDYLIDGKSIDDIGRDLLENESEYAEILDITPELICTDKNNDKYYYAKLAI